MRISAIVGTRPELIKLSTVIKALFRHRIERVLDFHFVHTGQHYDWEMSQQFIAELDLPQPDRFLGVGSGSHGRQAAGVIERVEEYVESANPDLVFVLGDTNSTMGAAVACAKPHVPLVHVEAGCRSFDPFMPEELNRRITSCCATYHFAPTRCARLNLLREGIPSSAIHLTGHPIVDVVADAGDSQIVDKCGLAHDDYVVFTLHREENTDSPKTLADILRAMAASSRRVIFPCHPRTAKKIEAFNLRVSEPIEMVPPVSYFSMLALVREARYVATDSGGLQQEAFLLGTPCVTLRRRTEWLETVRLGANSLAGTTPSTIVFACRRTDRRSPQLKERLGQLSRTRFPFGRAGVTGPLVSLMQKLAASGPATYRKRNNSSLSRGI